MTTYYAQPYDVTADGFYFTDKDSYLKNITSVKNGFGEQVEEFELQFIDGDLIDAELAKALGLYQSTILQFMECVDEWDDHQKRNVIIAVGECGYDFDYDKDDPDDFDVEIYELDNMKDLAMQFVEDGLFGEIPPAFQYYIDYDAIARDLEMDYSEAVIDGQNIIFRCD